MNPPLTLTLKAALFIEKISLMNLLNLTPSNAYSSRQSYNSISTQRNSAYESEMDKQNFIWLELR